MTLSPPQRRTFAAAWACTFLINIAWGCSFPLLNVYIREQGISLVLIGTLGTASSVAFSLGGILFGRLSDRLGRRRDLITAALIIGAGAMLTYRAADVYAHFLALTLIYMLTNGAHSVLIDALVTSILPADKRGGGFGWYRISGSLGFALAGSLLGASTGAFGVPVIFIIGAAALFSAAIASRFMHEQVLERAVEAAGGKPRPPGVLRTLILTGLIWFLAADIVSIVGSDMAYPFMNIYLAERFEATPGILGLLATVGVLAEIPAMIGLGRLSDRLGRPAILGVGFVAVTLSWLVLFLMPSLPWAFLARPLAGIGIIRYSVGVALISDRVPYEQRGTLLGLSHVTYGVGGLFAPSLGGLIAEATGIQSVFLYSFAICAVAAMVFLFTMRHSQPVTPSEAVL